MIITYKNLNTVAGNHVVISPFLKMCKPLKVRIESMYFDIIMHPSVPGNRQVAYRSGMGALIFESTIVFDGTQRVYAQIKL